MIEQTEYITNELNFFKEKSEVLDIIQTICNISDSSKCEDLIEKLKKILDNYQEQPQLLGPHIVDLLSPINLKFLNYINMSSPQFLKVSCLQTILPS